MQSQNAATYFRHPARIFSTWPAIRSRAAARSTYSYDAASQLTGIVYQGGALAPANLAYSYDLAGRRVGVSGSLASTQLPAAVSSAVYNANNQLTQWGSTAMTYDLNGNTLNDGTNSYVWDARNRLVSADNNGAVFSYDPLGRRVSKTVQSTTTNFLYDGVNAVQEFGTLPTANLLTGGVDERFLRTSATETDNYLTDAQGSTVALTNATGATEEQYSYGPYGILSASGGPTTNSYTYSGREFDGLGIDYYRARYYNPTTGRFLSEDPLGFDGDGPNLYTYAGDDPIDMSDQLGLFGGSPAYCARLQEKIQNVQNRIDKRLGELDEDPQGLPERCSGDRLKPSLSRAGHRKLINMDKALLTSLKTLYLASCSDNPPGAPATPGFDLNNVFDRQYWERVTGLSGAALTWYLIVSEGSRLYPPRDLVPVP